PTTVTGSIGIFAIVPTFEETLGEIGVTRDGVGTGPFVGALDPIGGVGDAMARALQSNVEYGYRRFVDLVAEGR
ncbi:MAG: S49 family peptidase, partial [Gammaproteobacteria bacterium]|nr:S49 family peptidase [Gammaproteobacteria bacterium]